MKEYKKHIECRKEKLVNEREKERRGISRRNEKRKSKDVEREGSLGIGGGQNKRSKKSGREGECKFTNREEIIK